MVAKNNTNALERVLAHLYRLAVRSIPAAKDAQYAEWWAHCRPHSAHHQLHFDSADEGRGKVEHPLASSVMYLTEGMGGPTLVTDQILGGKLATKGWLSYPSVNRYTVFDGRVLHGVIPGVGATPRAGERRVTFMVAFWKDISSKPANEGGWGAAVRYPSGSKRYKWPSLLAQAATEKGKNKKRPAKNQHTLKDIAPHPVGEVWEPLAAEAGLCKLLGGVARVPHINECFQP